MLAVRNVMRPTHRLYATIASGKSLRGKGPVLTLEHVRHTSSSKDEDMILTTRSLCRGRR